MPSVPVVKMKRDTCTITVNECDVDKFENDGWKLVAAKAKKAGAKKPEAAAE